MQGMGGLNLSYRHQNIGPMQSAGKGEVWYFLSRNLDRRIVVNTYKRARTIEIIKFPIEIAF